MKKNIITMIFTICFMVWIFPLNIFAYEITTTVKWSDIKSRIDEFETISSGNMWRWTKADKTLLFYGGYKLEIEASDIFSEDIIIHGNVTNSGTITGGTFNKEVTNNGIITGGTFNKEVTNSGTITGGTFNFNDPLTDFGLTNNGSIGGGEFNCKVNNATNGTISAGTFMNDVQNLSSITGGTFTKIINFGIIGEDVNYVDGGTPGGDPNPGDDEYGTPTPTPGDNNSNLENTTGNDNEYEFVEPVVIVVPEGQKYVDDVMEQLVTVPTDGKVVIDTKDWYCFNRTMAEKVTNMKDVTVTIKYMYQGKRYEVTIPAGSDIVSLLGETGFVGFRYLDLVFGGREITE